MIYEDLPTGAFEGKTGDELMQLYGITDRRDLRRLIREERMSGKPILNKGNKYFKSDDPRDYDAWLRTTFKKGTETVNVAKAVLRKRPAADGQMTLSEFMQSAEEGAADVQKETIYSEKV